MFDSHCHLDFPALAESLSSELAAARAVGVEGWLVPGCAPTQWQRLGALTQVGGVCVAVGLHPWWVQEVAERAASALSDSVAQLAEKARSLGAVALGELGLDGARAERESPAFELQRVAFEAQLEVARELELPVVLHVVRAHETALDCLRRLGAPRAGGVVHGFSGSLELAERYLRLGLSIGVGCQVTSEASRKLRDAVARLPLERLLLETDAPDQRPRGGASSLPAHGRPLDLMAVAQAVAELRGISPKELGRASTDNARRLFGV